MASGRREFFRNQEQPPTRWVDNNELDTDGRIGTSGTIYERHMSSSRRKEAENDQGVLKPITCEIIIQLYPLRTRHPCLQLFDLIIARITPGVLPSSSTVDRYPLERQ